PPGDYSAGYYRSNSLWKLAVYYVGKKNVEAASLYALRFLDYHPDSLGARYLLGAGVYFENGRYNESLPHLMKLDRMPASDLKEAGIDTERLDFLLGQILMMRFDPRAITYFSRCKDSNPLAEQYWMVLTNQPVKNYVPLLEFLRKHPDHLPARVALLYALEQQEKYEAYADELIRVSTLAALRGESDTGLKVVQRARELRNERPDLKIREFDIHRLSWLHLMESDNPHRALIEARKAISVGDAEGAWGPDQKRAAAVEQLARLLANEEISGFDEARQLLLDQVGKIPDRHESYMMLSLVEWRQHRWEAALKYMSRARELAPNRLDYLFLESVLLSEQGQLEKAEEGYRKVLTANSRFAPAQNSLGYLLAREGKNLDEARALIEEAVQQEPSNAAYRDSLGWVYYQSGQYNLARFHLEMAATLMKHEQTPSPEVYEHLGDVYHKLGMPLRALEAYREAIQVNDGPGKRPPGWLEGIQGKIRRIKGDAGNG
ncbi:MAG: tetratricopeptide repeat protein, partial [Leptospiraceae bacterium]|nr:tetratricopeptide repeat protein [Leptospiraceae bacterium]